jgi:hypothetical protein
MHKTQEEIDGRKTLNMLYELGLQELNRREQTIFLKIWQDDNRSSTSIAQELNLHPSTVRRITSSMFVKIGNFIGVGRLSWSTLRESVTDFLNKSQNFDDFQGVLQEIFHEIDLAQARMAKKQEEIQSLAKETDELLNQLEYKAS